MSQNQPGTGPETFTLLLYFPLIWSTYIHTYCTILHMCTLWGGLLLKPLKGNGYRMIVYNDKLNVLFLISLFFSMIHLNAVLYNNNFMWWICQMLLLWDSTKPAFIWLAIHNPSFSALTKYLFTLWIWMLLSYNILRWYTCLLSFFLELSHNPRWRSR